MKKFWRILNSPEFNPWESYHQYKNIFEMLLTNGYKHFESFDGSPNSLYAQLAMRDVNGTKDQTNLTEIMIYLTLKFLTSEIPFDPQKNQLPTFVLQLVDLIHPVIFLEIKGASYKSGLHYNSKDMTALKATLVPYINRSKYFGPIYAESIASGTQYHLANRVYKDPIPAFIDLARPLITSGSYKQQDLALLKACCNKITDFSALKSELKEYEVFEAVNNCRLWLILPETKAYENCERLIPLENSEQVKFFAFAKWWMTADHKHATAKGPFEQLLKYLKSTKLFYYSNDDLINCCDHLPISQIAVELFFEALLTIIAIHQTTSASHMAECKDILKAAAENFPILNWFLYKLYNNDLLRGTSIGKTQSSYVTEFWQRYSYKLKYVTIDSKDKDSPLDSMFRVCKNFCVTAIAT